MNGNTVLNDFSSKIVSEIFPKSYLIENFLIKIRSQGGSEREGKFPISLQFKQEDI